MVRGHLLVTHWPVQNKFHDGRCPAVGEVFRTVNRNTGDAGPIASHQPSQGRVCDVTHGHHWNRNVTRHWEGKDALLPNWARLTKEILHKGTATQMTNRGAGLVQNILHCVETGDGTRIASETFAARRNCDHSRGSGFANRPPGGPGKSFVMTSHGRFLQGLRWNAPEQRFDTFQSPTQHLGIIS